MIFIADHHYQITYKDAAAVNFMALDDNAAFHLKRVSVGNVGKQLFLYELLVEDWEGLKEIYLPEPAMR